MGLYIPKRKPIEAFQLDGTKERAEEIVAWLNNMDPEYNAIVIHPSSRIPEDEWEYFVQYFDEKLPEIIYINNWIFMDSGGRLHVTYGDQFFDMYEPVPEEENVIERQIRLGVYEMLRSHDPEEVKKAKYILDIEP
jgi:hypothetical protein